MKKIEYQAPAMEVVDLKYTQPLLTASANTGESTGGGAIEVPDDTVAD